MASLEELRNERLRKLELLKERGIDPYPATTARDHAIAAVLERFDELAESEQEVTLAGRVMALRGQGALVFGDLFDGTGRIQLLLKKDEMDEETRQLFIDVADIGDFVEFTGKVFVTNRQMDSCSISKKKLWIVGWIA